MPDDNPGADGRRFDERKRHQLRDAASLAGEGNGRVKGIAVTIAKPAHDTE